MIIDMHVHTRVSPDADALVEEYCQVIQRFREFHPFDGFVITDHRRIFPHPHTEEYERLSEKYNVLILQGVEIDTNLGHLLLYGVTEEFLEKVDISKRDLDEKDVIDTIRSCGGIAIPSHPLRDSGFGDAIDAGLETMKDIKIVEELNGSHYPEENEVAVQLVARNGLKGIGGSDSHFVHKEWFLTYATEFFNPIATMDDLVAALYAGNFRPIKLDNSVLGNFK